MNLAQRGSKQSEGGSEVFQGSRPMQRWYQPCMQQLKPRKEAFSGCGCETADVAHAPTIHEGLVVFTVARGEGRVGGSAVRSLPALRRRLRLLRGGDEFDLVIDHQHSSGGEVATHGEGISHGEASGLQAGGAAERSGAGSITSTVPAVRSQRTGRSGLLECASRDGQPCTDLVCPSFYAPPSEKANTLPFLLWAHEREPKRKVRDRT
jgi:hypothetical protein